MAVSKQEVILEFQADTDEVVKGVENLDNNLVKASGDANLLAAKLNALTGGAVVGLKNAVQNTKQFITGLKLTRAALIGTGIGALVIAIVELVRQFGKTEEGARKLKKAFAPIQAIIDVLQVKVSALGGAFFKLFSGDFRGAVDDFNRSLGATNDEYQNQIRLYDELIDREFALQDARIKQTVATARTRAEIKELNLIAEDTTRSIEEREEAAEKAGNLERALFEERKRQAEEELAIFRARKDATISGTEDREREAELEAKIFELSSESLELQTTLNNKLNTIRAEGNRRLEEEAALREKNRQEELAAVLELLAARQELEDELYTLGLSAQEREEQALMKEYDRRIAIAGDDEGLIQAATEQLYKDLAELRKKYADEEQSEEDERIDRIIERQNEIDSLLRTQRENELFDLQQWYQTKRKEAEKDGQTLVGLTEAYEKQRAEIEEKYNQETLENDRAVAQSKYQMAAQALGALQALNEAFAKDGDIEAKKAFERNKALAYGTAVVNTALAVSDALAKDATFPGSRFIAAAAAGVTGLAQVATIQRTQFKSATADVGQTTTPNLSGRGPVGAPTLDLGFFGEGAGRGPIQAYVLAENVSNAQQANQKIQDQILIG